MPAHRFSDPALLEVARYFQARTGIDLSATGGEHAEAGVRRALRRSGASDAGEYRELLETDARILDDLIGELTVGETYFFRDAHHFDFVGTEILPAVRERRSDGGPGLRAWSAGCASGEEIYSLAILLEEEDMLSSARLVATDLSSAALELARTASYRSWSLRGAGAERAGRYMAPAGKLFELAPRIRDSVRFGVLNLATDLYPSPALGLHDLDVVLCRNVLIYLDEPTIRSVAERLHDCLAEGGYLITGPSDPPLGQHAPFDLVTREGSVYYRRIPAAEAATRPFPEVGARRKRRRGTPPGTPRRAPTPVPPPAVPRAEDGRTPPPADALLDRVRALANLDPARAAEEADEALRLHPLVAPLHHLRAMILVALGRDVEAERALRNVLYLDADLAVPHFVLGSVLRRRGDLEGARRAFGAAWRIASELPPDLALDLAEGETAERLASAAEAQLASLALEGRR